MHCNPLLGLRHQQMMNDKKNRELKERLRRVLNLLNEAMEDLPTPFIKQNLSEARQEIVDVLVEL